MKQTNQKNKLTKFLKVPLPLIFTVILYLIFFWIRTYQDGWEPKNEAFKGLRSQLDQQIAQYLPSPQAELMSGILLGQNKNLPGQFKLALRDTSTLHIVVASGQNLSMVAGFFLLLSGFIKRKVAITLSLVAVIFYVILTGVQVPVLRAAVMVTLAFLGQILGRERDGWWVLAVTVALMLLVNPNWITSLSFQLSVLATIGVVVVSPIILERLKKVPSFLSQDLAVSLSAQLLVLPVIAQNFHQLSLVALPTNILILWTVAPVMILGTLLLAVSPIPPLAAIVAFVINLFLSYFIYIVKFFASLSWSWIYVGEQLWIVWVGYYLIIGSIIKILYDTKKTKED